MGELNVCQVVLFEVSVVPIYCLELNLNDLECNLLLL